jgi:hypothetical protein
VADDELEVGVAVERAAEDKPEDVGGCVDVPAPGGGGQRGGDLGRVVAGVGGFDEILGRGWGVEVEGDVERFGGFEDGPEVRVVEVPATGVAVDDGALESVGLDSTLELVGGGVGCWRGQCGEPREAGRVMPDRLGKVVVGLAGEGDGVWRVELFDAAVSDRTCRSMPAVSMSVILWWPRSQSWLIRCGRYSMSLVLPVARVWSLNQRPGPSMKAGVA